MQMIEAVIKPHKLDAVKDALGVPWDPGCHGG